MKKKTAIAIAAIGAIALLAAFGGRYAAGHRDPKHAYRFLSFRVNSLLDDIKATDAQRAQVNAMKDQLFQDGMNLKTSHQSLHKDLMAQWAADKVDATKAHAEVDQQINALRAFAHKAVDSGIKLHDLLTPEQRAAVKDEFQHHHQEQE